MIKGLKTYGSLMVITILIDVWITWYLNTWREAFWESVKNVETKNFYPLLIHFTIASVVFVLSYAYGNYCLNRVSLALRNYFTKKYTNLWQQSKAKLTCDTPDQRIAVDIDLVTHESIFIASQSVSHILIIIVFGVVLWQLSPFFYHVPGLLLGITILYCLAGNLAVGFQGNRIIPVDIDKQQAEAEYRQSLMKSYENHDEHDLKTKFSQVIETAKRLFIRERNLDFTTSAYNQLGIIWPLLILVPGFFAGKFVFGILMQAINAVETFVDSSSYVINSYPTIIELIGSYRRIKTFLKEIQ